MSGGHSGSPVERVSSSQAAPSYHVMGDTEQGPLPAHTISQCLAHRNSEINTHCCFKPLRFVITCYVTMHD
jgi:hypothetical protein